MAVVNHRVVGRLKLRQQIDALRLSAKKKHWIHRAMGRKVRVYSRARIRAQKDLDGKSFKKRADGRKKKMETGLARKMEVFATQEEARITWRNWKMAEIAMAQQEGITEDFTAEKARKIHGKPDYKAAATRKQAKALRAEGYTVARGKHKKRKTPTLKWITENLKLGQAGLILQVLRDESRKKRWKVKLAKRSFLGVNLNEEKELLNIAAEQILKLK